jgi:hypothetical protein
VLTRASPFPTHEPRASKTEVTLGDVDTGEESAPIGDARIVLADAQGRVWLGGLDDGQWIVSDVATRDQAVIPCPWTVPIAAAGSDPILAQANPTTGVEVRWAGGFEMAWSVISSLDLFDVRMCEFVTVCDWFEHEQRASFGAR